LFIVVPYKINYNKLTGNFEHVFRNIGYRIQHMRFYKYRVPNGVHLTSHYYSGKFFSLCI
jgi:hypothetical protein